MEKMGSTSRNTNRSISLPCWKAEEEKKKYLAFLQANEDAVKTEATRPALKSRPRKTPRKFRSTRCGRPEAQPPNP